MRWKPLAAALAALCAAIAAGAQSPASELAGGDLIGGAADLFGGIRGSELRCNFVYAAPTGGRSVMEGRFRRDVWPANPLRLYLKAVDDDFEGQCAIAVLLNGRELFAGKSGFPDKGWQVRSWPIPDGLLKPGDNTLRIENREQEGRVGMPPWFMVARCAVAPPGFVFRRDLARDFRVTIPAAARPFPKLLPAGAEPGFAVRGIKGWMWRPEQYLAEIPWLVKGRMNFLMNCYASMFDVEHFPFGDARSNRWWEPLPPAKRRAYEQVMRRCAAAGIAFCFSMNPNLSSARPLDYGSAADLEALWRHYAWAQSRGVRWFNVSLDDISQGIDPSGQARVVNELTRRLKRKDPGARMIFTPTIYWGDGGDPAERTYLRTLARELDPDVRLFWTGAGVVGGITRKAAEAYGATAGHKLFIWDNYPVNDNTPTMHLGPLVNRDPDLCRAAEGYMSNSMCTQNEANRLPMLTCAEYAYNPAAYDPEESIGQALLLCAGSRAQADCLRRLVEAYPGFLLYAPPSTSTNPVRDRLVKLIAQPQGRSAAEAYTDAMEKLLRDLRRAFPGRYRAEGRTLAADVAFMRGALAAEP